MHLSFVPGDLHLTKTKDGTLVVNLAGKEILKTKSQRLALAKFHSLKEELEKKFSGTES
jgi:hypothetical protein